MTGDVRQTRAHIPCYPLSAEEQEFKWSHGHDCRSFSCWGKVFQEAPFFSPGPASRLGISKVAAKTFHRWQLEEDHDQPPEPQWGWCINHCTMAKFQWEVWHLHFIENFQLCLSFYPRPNISDRFVSLASHFIRVQIFQIHLWGTKWMVVNHALFYSTREVIENMESESELINRIFGHPAASKKRGEIFVKQFFQTLDAIFSY